MGDDKKKVVVIVIVVFFVLLVSFLILTWGTPESTREYSTVDLLSCKTDDCLILLAIEESNPNYCEGVSVENSSVCYSSIALKVRDYNLCDKADSYSAQTCKIAIAHDSKDMNACEKYSFEDSIENLMLGNPTKELCKSVIEGELVEARDGEGSKVKMIMESDFLVCEEYKNNPNIQENQLKLLMETCYYEVAISNQDVSFCEKTSNPLKYYCLARASADKIKSK